MAEPAVVWPSKDKMTVVLAKNGVGVVIAAGRGRYAGALRRRTQATRVDIIDDFKQYKRKSGKSGNVEEVVDKKFARWVNKGQMVIKSKNPPAAANEYDNDSLDWVSIDNVHTNIISWMNTWWRKVKVGGYLLVSNYNESTVHDMVQNFLQAKGSDADCEGQCKLYPAVAIRKVS